MAKEMMEGKSSHMEEPEVGIGELVSRALGMAIRQRWTIGLVACFVAVCVVAGALVLPNKYTSEATLFAVQQRVPERYVTPTMNADPSQALEAMVQEVLSRPRLLGVIDELGLYREKAGLQPDELVDLIRKDLSIDPLERMLGAGQVNAFRISFVAESPQLAHAVTRKLTTLFIEQNLKTRTDQAETTTEFLSEQLATTRGELLAQEQRLRDYKMQYLGQLPEQQVGNLGILSSLQTQLNSVMTSRSQAQQQRLFLESMLTEAKNRSRRPAVLRSSTGEIVTPAQAAERELVRLQSEKRALLTRYTASHPDVQKKDQEIAYQQGMVRNLRLATMDQPKSAEPEQPPQENAEDGMMIAQLTSQLRANQFELDSLDEKEQKLRSDISDYQGRLNMTPVREQQLASMQRDYDLLKEHYGDLLKKEQESQLAKNLEKKQEGQQFRLAEPPNLPTVPSSPDRLKFSLIGLAAGIALGCGLAFLLEFLRPSYRTEAEIKQLELPFVVGIPVLMTDKERRWRGWKRAFEWCGALVLVSIVGAAEFYVYLFG